VALHVTPLLNPGTGLKEQPRQRLNVNNPRCNRGQGVVIDLKPCRSAIFSTFRADSRGKGLKPPVGTGGYSHPSPPEKVLCEGCSFRAYCQR